VLLQLTGLAICLPVTQQTLEWHPVDRKFVATDYRPIPRTPSVWGQAKHKLFAGLLLFTVPLVALAVALRLQRGVAVISKV